MGFFDAEGMVSVNTRSFYFNITVINSNLELLEYLRDLLKEKFSISSVIRVNVKKGTILKSRSRGIIKANVTTYRLEINRRSDVETYYKEIGFVIKRKQEKLRLLLEIDKSCKTLKCKLKKFNELFC